MVSRESDILRVVLLAPASVIHTQRWVEALHARGVRVVLATQHDDAHWQPSAGVRVVRFKHSGRAGYLLNVPALRRLLRDVRPDLLNAHYASGYGTSAALARFRPWLLSVWGSDVHDFPYQSRFKGWLLRRNLRHADALASTSVAMAAQVRRLVADAASVNPPSPSTTDIAITPFGIDATRFAPRPRAHRGFVVGTVKTLAPKYGIDVLVRAYAEFALSVGPEVRAGLSLVIVGDGPQRGELEALRAGLPLGIGASVRFIGAVPHAEVPQWLNGLDVYVAASRLDSESFGVAVLEASACAVPVVVSDAGGLPEVVVQGLTGLVVPRDDVPSLALALRRLFDTPTLREQLGRAGRQHVLDHYEWSHCVDRMLACYAQVLRRHDGRSAANLSTAAGRKANLLDDASVIAGRVSVIVPCRNERPYVEAFCASLWQQALPDGWSLEVIVADGISSDGSAALLRQMSVAEPRLQVIDNPQRIVATGLNLALARARGEVIVRLDVHTEYAPDYIAECLTALAASGADNVGGPWQARADASGEPMQRAVAAAFQSRWVAGGALSRRLDYDGWVDTVYLGCWPRASFARFGGFDERLVRNQDDEHNLRIARAGGRVWQASRIRSVYRPRAALAQVFRQYLQYGYWKPFVMKTHGQAASLRQLVPGGYVALQVALLLAVPFGAPTWIGLGLGAAYLAAVAAMTLAVARGAGLDAAAAVRVPAVIVAYHVGYGLGFLAGVWDVFWRRQGRARFASSSR